jgi:3-oxoacyl-[acyl-carrier protein] reductase
MSLSKDRPLDGKFAIVTGASRGIGRAIALRLAEDGASVAVNYRSNADAAEIVVTAVKDLGGEAIAIQADMGDVNQIRRLFSQTLHIFGGLDILVNNAGTAAFAPIVDIDESLFDLLFAANCKGVFFAMQEAARHLRDGGRIVNISSGITILGGPGGSAYAGTKGAVEQFTMAVAKELGARGITVNTVSPGGTETDLLDAAVSKEYQAVMAGNSAFGRLGQPDDIADVVAFLCSDGGRWITGQNIRATGGAA